MSVYFSRAECNDLRDARINVVCQAMSESYSLFLFGWALLKFSDIICLTSQTISGWEQPHWLWHRIGLSHRSSASRCWVCVFILPWRKSYPKQSLYGIFPIISIYFPCIYHKNQPSVGKYVIHRSYGWWRSSGWYVSFVFNCRGGRSEPVLWGKSWVRGRRVQHPKMPIISNVQHILSIFFSWAWL